jgi:RNA polymerase sigma-70 factor (ECF subfamily)
MSARDPMSPAPPRDPRTLPEDDAVLDRLHLGDESAFDELVDRYHLPVFHLAYRLTGNRADAEDLTQEVFVRAYRSLADFRRASSLKTWLFRIATNLWHDTWRRRRPVPEAAPEASHDPGALIQLERQELRAEIEGAIACLPEKQRATAVLRLIHDLSFKEIGEVLGSPIGTVKANYHFAVTRLRDLLRETAARHSPFHV